MAHETHAISQRLDRLESKDAIFDAPNGSMVAAGYDAIQEMFINTFRIRGPSYHWTHDVTVDIDSSSPDLATGLVLGHAETSPDGVVSIAAMRYEDEYRREGGCWLFSKRTIHFLYYVPADDYSAGLNQTHRVVIGGETLAADYPEKLAPWLSFI